MSSAFFAVFHNGFPNGEGVMKQSKWKGDSPLKIMFSAGEVSGDLHGERLAKAIREHAPETELIGFGGDRMARAGVHLFRNFSSYNLMGVWEVLKNLRRILELLNALTDFMRQEKPDLLVLIDYPDFNWRLAKRAKAIGIPVFSYIPPSAWAWRKGRAADCTAIADEFVAIFPFETKVYEEAGANISFVGNPLVDTVKPELSEAEAKTYFGIQGNPHIVLLLPGSRKQEIRLLFPAMLGAARRLLQEDPNTVFFLPVADGIDTDALREQIATAKVPVQLTRENRYSLMKIADVAVATSGTVVMEAALLGLPCVVLYRMAKLNYWIGRMLVHVDHISLPNLLMSKRIQPELLQDEVEPERIARELRSLYRGEPHRDEVTADLKQACEKLGRPGASQRIAEIILSAAGRLSVGRSEKKE